MKMPASRPKPRLRYHSFLFSEYRVFLPWVEERRAIGPWSQWAVQPTRMRDLARQMGVVDAHLTSSQSRAGCSLALLLNRRTRLVRLVLTALASRSCAASVRRSSSIELIVSSGSVFMAFPFVDLSSKVRTGAPGAIGGRYLFQRRTGDGEDLRMPSRQTRAASTASVLLVTPSLLSTADTW